MYVSQIICSSLREKKHTAIFSIKNKFFSSLLAYHYCSISLFAQVYLLDFFSVLCPCTPLYLELVAWVLIFPQDQSVSNKAN